MTMDSRQLAKLEVLMAFCAPKEADIFPNSDSRLGNGYSRDDFGGGSRCCRRD